METGGDNMSEHKRYHPPNHHNGYDNVTPSYNIQFVVCKSGRYSN